MHAMHKQPYENNSLMVFYFDYMSIVRQFDAVTASLVSFSAHTDYFEQHSFSSFFFERLDIIKFPSLSHAGLQL